MFDRLFRYDGTRSAYDTSEIEDGLYHSLILIVNSINAKTGVLPRELMGEEEFENLSQRAKLNYVDTYSEALDFINLWQPIFMEQFDELEGLTTQWANNWYIRGHKGDKENPKARAEDLFVGSFLSDRPEAVMVDMVELLEVKVLFHTAQQQLFELEGDNLKASWQSLKYHLHSRLVVDERDDFDTILNNAEKLTDRTRAYMAYFKAENIIDLEGPLKNEAANRIHRLSTEEIFTLASKIRDFEGHHIDSPRISAYEPFRAETVVAR